MWSELSQKHKYVSKIIRQGKDEVPEVVESFADYRSTTHGTCGNRLIKFRHFVISQRGSRSLPSENNSAGVLCPHDKKEQLRAVQGQRNVPLL